MTFLQHSPVVGDLKNSVVHIVLDANSIIDTGFRADSKVYELLSKSKILKCRIYVPAVAFEEVVAHFSRDMSRKANSIGREIGNFSAILGRKLDSPTANLNQPDELERFRTSLQERLSDAHAKMPSYPGNSHEEIVKRATSRVRPFDENGNGYRDTLIWLNTLGLADEVQGTIILVSKDKGFKNEHGSLHNDLISEVATNGHPSDKVILRQTIPDLFEMDINPLWRKHFSEQPHELLALLDFDVKEAVAQGAQEYSSTRDWEPRELTLPWNCEWTILDSVDEVSNLEAIDTSPAHDNKISVNMTADLMGTFSLWVNRNDWDATEKDKVLYLVEQDASDFGVLASISLPLRCKLDLVVDPLNVNTGEVKVNELTLPARSVVGGE